MAKAKQAKEQVQYLMFDKPDEDRTATFALSLEGKSLWIHREYLAQFSPQLKRLLLEDMKDSKKMKLPNKLADMRELLQCLYPPFKPIDDSNLEIVMTLALEYDIEFIRSAVREYMEMRLEEQLNSRNGGAINHMTTLLVRGDQFNMMDFVDKCAQWFAKQTTSKVEDAIRRVSPQSGLVLSLAKMKTIDKKLRESEKKNKDLEQKLQVYNLTMDK